ncbi:MAG: serine dehydratase subunit alpha family protein, partial [Clostridia bacterium]
MKNLQTKLVNILRAEVKPALGCTEPVAVALACAKAKETLGEEVVKCTIGLSPNVYKNGMCVGIPGTERLGLKISAAMGLIGGKSENGLRVLETLTTDDVKVAENFMDNNEVNISPIDTDEKIYIEVVLEGENNTAKVIIRTKHDNIVLVEKNEEVLVNEEVVEVAATRNEPKENILDTITIKEIVEAMENVDFEEIKFLLDGIAMNEEIAKYGLNEKVGVGVGFGIKKSMEAGLLGDDL